MTAVETRVRPDRGRVGIVAVIVAETAVFTIFVVAYLYYVGKSLSGPTPAEVLDLPVVVSILLWSSSVTTISPCGRCGAHGCRRSSCGGF